MTAPACCDESGTVPAIFLEQGELRATTHAEVITTILGSCVAVCLLDPVARIAGMNHFLLARSPVGPRSPRYGDGAVEMLAAAMIEIGAEPARLVAKVFGGAAVLPLLAAQACIGSDNVQIALNELNRLNIPVIAHKTGGYQGLIIRMHTLSGDVYAKTLGNMWGLHNTVLIKD